MEEFFAKRLEPIEEALAPWGVRVPAGAELEAADDQIEDRMEELKAAAGLDQVQDEALTELGRRWAKGELKGATVMDRIGNAGNLRRGERPSRLGVVLQGARVQMRRDLDRPEWSPKALRESCVEPAQKVLDAAATELVESWRGLPSWLQDRVRNDRYPRIAGVMKFVDVASIAGADLEAARRAAATWDRWGFDVSGGVKVRPYEFLGLGRLLESASPYSGKGGERSLVENVLWTDAAAEMGAGYRLDILVMDQMVEKLAPLADPLGSQAEEYNRRVEVFDRVQDWRNVRGRQIAQRVEAGMPVSRASREELKRRESLKPHQVLAQMRDSDVIA
ncbi:MAG: hypothetical protein ACTH2Y_08430 [Corynebacterium sp.]|uniref:hypothetical protein n=1 Tax=Corynebacterium sp. TaxID=1720 RepID=UPI003F90C6A5